MTTQVAFYQLRSRQPNGKFRLACHTVNTAFQKGHNVYIAVDDESQCTYFNELLWTFSQNSFVPHTIYSAKRSIDTEKFPVIVSCVRPPHMFNDVLATLRDEVPEFFQQFSRVAEVVDADERDMHKAKLRSETYRSILGAAPESHLISRSV